MEKVRAGESKSNRKHLSRWYWLEQAKWKIAKSPILRRSNFEMLRAVLYINYNIIHAKCRAAARAR